MREPRTWMVRAGRGGRFFDDFRDRSIVAIGWVDVGDLSGFDSREDLAEAVRRAYPAYRDQAVIMASGQLFRFAKGFSKGDRVVTYDPGARTYLRGEIVGPYTYHPDEENEEFRNQRQVNWTGEVPRDSLSQVARNSLGAISTIFAVASEVSAELWDERPASDTAVGASEDVQETHSASPITLELTDDDVSSRANEAIKDRIAELSWQDMQELVAGLLRAMGYKTTISPAGADRGRDIVASPDGFGFQEPKIVVEVKHRPKERMGSQEVRSFLGGLHTKDIGLYVSTGGFTKEANYEAERASIRITLMNFESLVDAILDHYPAIDEETKQILPLKRVYWPINR